jgi:hypothetical protein
MLNYERCYGRFPPAAVYSADGQPLLSWRVLLLPFLGRNDLYGRFQFNEQWDSPGNKQLLSEMPGVYTPPSGRTTERFQTRYQIVTGAGTLFAGKDGPMISDINDGVAFTLLVVETARVVPWTKPDDLVYAVDQPLPQFGGLFPDGCYAALVEGTVHFIKKETDEETLRALITPADGKCACWEPDSSVVYPQPRAHSPKGSTTSG